MPNIESRCNQLKLGGRTQLCNPELQQTTLIDAQTQFARHAYENHQAMIRLVDTKATFMLTLIIFLSYTGFSFVNSALEQFSWRECIHSVLGWILILTTIAFLVTLMLTLGLIHRVVAPRFGRKSFQAGRDLFFSSDVVAYAKRDSYVEAVKAASYDVLLENLCSEVFAVALIADSKLKNLAALNRLLLFAIVTWSLNVFGCLTLFCVGKR